jgi:predicted DNA-binding protein (UPF0251 family)
MPRPEKRRRTRCNPAAYYFKPTGIPMDQLEEIALSIDELESIRLADLNGFFQEVAAAKMDISRATFGRIIMRAHNKIAEAIISGKAIRIEENSTKPIIKKSKQFCKGCEKKIKHNLRNKNCQKCLPNIKE